MDTTFEDDPHAWFWLGGALLISIGMLVYLNSFWGAFLFDDPSNITDNKALHDLSKPLEIVTFNRRRPVIYLTFAINYALGKYDVRGYHLVNVAIHIAASLTLFGLVWRCLASPQLVARYGRVAPFAAWAAALIWMVHPLQTQSVTYIVQRTEALCGLFYLLVLYASIRAAAAHRPWLWYAAGVVACWLGMWTKEVMLTAPLLLILFDRAYVCDSWQTMLERRWGFYLACALSWVPFFINSDDVFKPGVDAMGFGSRLITWWEFFRTQPEVILHYLKLSYWPQHLCLDYRWPVQDSWPRIIMAGSIVTTLFLSSLVLYCLRPAAGFVGLAFFFVLAPSSSFIPIVDVAFEHRMYLPLAAVVVFTVLIVEAAWRNLRAMLPALDRYAWQAPVLLLVLVSSALSVRTILRNLDYHSDVRMWETVVAAAPDNPRAYHNLAVALEHAKRYQDAVEPYQLAIDLSATRKGHARHKYYYNLANLLARLNRTDEAIAAYQQVIRLDSTNPDGYLGLAAQYDKQKRFAEAAAQYRIALRLRPDAIATKASLAVGLVRSRSYAEAIPILREVVLKEPQRSESWLWLARALVRSGQAADAVSAYDYVRRSQPANTTAVIELAWLLATTEDGEVRDGPRAMEMLAPWVASTLSADVPALDAYAAAQAESGRYDEAVLTAKKAEELARAQTQSAVAQQSARRRMLYESRSAYRSSPAGEQPWGW